MFAFAALSQHNTLTTYSAPSAPSLHHTFFVHCLSSYSVCRRRLTYLLDTGFCDDAEWEELVGCVHQVEAEGMEGVAVRMMQECCAALK